MDQKKVKTEGSYQDMAQQMGVDQETIQSGVEVVEQAANVEVEVPEEK
jgi:hypothetical protein